MGKIKGVLIDFDGVISRRSIEKSIEYIHNYVNNKLIFKYGNDKAFIPYNFIANYIKLVICFDTHSAIKLLFDSLGLMDCMEDFSQNYTVFETKSENIPIEADFSDFVLYCNSNSIRCGLFSLASSERVKVIETFNLTPISFSGAFNNKSNLEVYKRLKAQMNVEFSELLYIDDSPIALRAGKLSGLNTVMMLNDIFTENDFHEFRSFIDYKAVSFSNVLEILRGME